MLSRIPRSCIGSGCARLPLSRLSGYQTNLLIRYYASKSFPPHSIISMPALSPTMTSGNIGNWHKAPGDSLTAGDVLVEIETDKAQMDFEFQEDGVLAKLLLPSGEKDVPVGTPIAVLVEDGVDIAEFESFTTDDASASAPTSGSGAADPPSEKSSSSTESNSNKDNSAPAPTSTSATSAESASTGRRLELSLDREPLADPSVRKLALEKGVLLSTVTGSGPGGRITKQDVESATMASSSAPTATYEDVPASSMRKVIANRLTESKTKNPHYYISSTISVSKLQKLRSALNSTSDGGYKLSINDFLVKALSVAARKVPAANSSWREEKGQVTIRQHHTVDVSVAVATPSGLVTPIVKNVSSLGLKEISNAIKDLGSRARENKLKPDEYQGGTITISNLGMNAAVDHFTAVINPPQSTIIAVGTVKKVAVPLLGDALQEPGVQWDDQIVITGSFDHKVVDGAQGGEFMRELKRVIENPLEMML